MNDFDFVNFDFMNDFDFVNEILTLWMIFDFVNNLTLNRLPINKKFFASLQTIKYYYTQY